jgi:hypothetical protein
MAAVDLALNSKIPTGVWTLYFHSPGEKKWSIDTFHKLGTVASWEDFWNLVNALEDTKWCRGMFFWMRGSVPPLWENFQNIKGGSYSMCIGETESIDIFHRYAIGCMCGFVTTNAEDIIQGITISPKKGFHVIKLWNKDATNYNKASGMAILDRRVQPGEIKYTPHVEKKM